MAGARYGCGNTAKAAAIFLSPSRVQPISAPLLVAHQPPPHPQAPRPNQPPHQAPDHFLSDPPTFSTISHIASHLISRLVSRLTPRLLPRLSPSLSPNYLALPWQPPTSSLEKLLNNHSTASTCSCFLDKLINPVSI